MDLASFRNRPFALGLSALAVATTLLYWTGYEISPLEMSDAAVGPEPWRLVTSALVHADPLHLIFNLYWLIRLGGVFETRFGTLRLAAFVVAVAAVSIALEFAFLDGGIGLSGVGYGLFGCFWAAKRCREVYAVEALSERDTQLFVVWFFFCVILTWMDVMPVANIAHGGGALAGALLGFAVSRFKNARAQGIASVVAFVLLAAFALLGAGPLRGRLNLDGSAAADMDTRALDAMERGELVLAEDLSTQAVTMAPRDPRLRHNHSVVLDRQGRLEEALAEERRAYEIDSSYRDKLAISCVRLGNRKWEEGDFETALELYREATEIDPSNTSIRTSLEVLEQAAAAVRELSPETPQHDSLPDAE